MKNPFVLWSVFCICCVAAIYSDAGAQVVLSEIMYDPAASENHDEFVEIKNLSSSDSVDLTGWQISDGNGTDKLIAHKSGMVLSPGRFCLILDASYFQNSTSYDSLIPPNSLIITIDNATFGSAGFSNSTAETVSLFDSTGQVITQYTYSLGNEPGFSDEKIDLNGDNSPNNWANSRRKFGTPGAFNSVSPLDIDLAVTSNDIRFFPKNLEAGSAVDIVATVKNVGLDTVAAFTLNFFEDRNRDQIPQTEELLSAPIVVNTALASGDTTDILQTFSGFTAGSHAIIVVIQLAEDQDLSNNQASAPLNIPFPAFALRLNEIMYSPSTGQTEWVELINLTDQTINLQNWSLSDKRIDSAVPVEIDFSVPANSFVVLAQDSILLELAPPVGTFIILNSWPGFNNDDDQVVLFDPGGNTIDSLHYRKQWGGDSDISLEKINPALSAIDSTNWGSSVALTGSTPGTKNSLSPFDIDLAIGPNDIRFFPQKVEAGSAVDIVATVRNAGLDTVAAFTLNFFEDRNCDRTPQTEELLTAPIAVNTTLASGDTTDILQTFSGFTAGSHMIIVVIEFAGDQDLSNNQASASLFISFPEKFLQINEIMYSPSTGQTEWVELVNLTDQTINLQNWSLSDKKIDLAVPVEIDFSIPANSFAVLAQDSILLELAPPAGTFIILNDWPGFNNDYDQVVLFDPGGNTIDSLHYRKQWGGDSGISLEKINPALSAIDSTNWGSSVALAGSTPGTKNSLSPFDIDLAIEGDGIRFIFRDAETGSVVDIVAMVRNVGKESVTSFTLSFFEDRNLDQSPQEKELLAAPLTYNTALAPGDTTEVSQTYSDFSAGKHSIIVKITLDTDQNLSNNQSSANLNIPFPANTLRINEIMYSPSTDRAEWVELINLGTQTVNLFNWALSDKGIESAVPVEIDFLVPANGFAVLAEDSTLLQLAPPPGTFLFLKKWPALKNDGDRVVLFDPSDKTIDSLYYRNEWGGDRENISLEKINPALSAIDSTNWSSSVAEAGSTPGARNSIFAESLVTGATLSVVPNPFSPDDDSRDNNTLISYSLPVTTARVNIKIYDLRGRLIRFLANNRSSGAENTIVWNGKDDRGRVAHMGIYIVFLQALNAANGVLASHKTTVVLAGKL